MATLVSSLLAILKATKFRTDQKANNPRRAAMTAHSDKPTSGSDNFDQPAAGWFLDVHQPGNERYWDGRSWTGQVRHVAPPPPAIQPPLPASTPPPPGTQTTDVTDWQQLSAQSRSRQYNDLVPTPPKRTARMSLTSKALLGFFGFVVFVVFLSELGSNLSTVVESRTEPLAFAEESSTTAEATTTTFKPTTTTTASSSTTTEAPISTTTAQPSLPTTPGGSLDDETALVIWRAVMVTNGISTTEFTDADILQLADTVCEGARSADGSGALFGLWMLEVAEESQVDAEVFGLATGATISAFCPEHNEVIEDMAELFGSG